MRYKLSFNHSDSGGPRHSREVICLLDRRTCNWIAVYDNVQFKQWRIKHQVGRNSVLHKFYLGSIRINIMLWDEPPKRRQYHDYLCKAIVIPLPPYHRPDPGPAVGSDDHASGNTIA